MLLFGSVAVAWNVTLEPTLVGDVVELAGFSTGPTVKVGALLPTVTDVVIDSAFTWNLLITRKQVMIITSRRDTLKKDIIVVLPPIDDSLSFL